ncbi:MAG: hypothetical protein JWL76_2127 [Thermoleophilia bacterium]|nr:hypothetical protein [Thermoleophilia bacterium]
MATDTTKPQEISDEDAQRRVEIRNRWNRYEGTSPASLRVAPGETDDNTNLPDVGTIIDASVDFLVGKEPTFHALNEQGEEQADASESIERVWKHAKKATLLRETATSGAIAGTFALKLLPDDGPEGIPGIVLLDPCDVQILTDPADIRKRTGYVIDQIVGADDEGSDLLLREEHEQNEGGQSWTIRYYRGRMTTYRVGMEVRQGVRWEQTNEIEWQHPFAAIVDGQNLPAPHQVWGRSDLGDDVLRLQDAINASASGERRILRHYASPQEVVTGGGDAKAVSQAMQQAAIGMALVLPEGGAYQIVQASTTGLDASHRFRESLTDKLFERAGVPRIAVGQLEGVGALSGVALLVMYRPLTAKTETKRATYGDAIDELNRRILVIMGEGEFQCGTTWADPLPQDTQAAVSEALDLQTLGVSKQTIFERLGLDWTLQQKRIQDEAGDPMGDEHGLLTRNEELQAEIDELQAEIDELRAAAVPQESDRAA